jgi:hypothetical protein
MAQEVVNVLVDAGAAVRRAPREQLRVEGNVWHGEDYN